LLVVLMTTAELLRHQQPLREQHQLMTQPPAPLLLLLLMRQRAVQLMVQLSAPSYLAEVFAALLAQLVAPSPCPTHQLCPHYLGAPQDQDQQLVVVHLLTPPAAHSPAPQHWLLLLTEITEMPPAWRKHHQPRHQQKDHLQLLLLACQ
jgi:hypothetical protein